MASYDTQSLVNDAWGELCTYARVGTVSKTEFLAARYLQSQSEGATAFGVYTIIKERYTFSADAFDFDPKLRDTITPTGGLPPSGVTSQGQPRVITSVAGSPVFLRFWIVEAQYPALASDLDQLATVFRPAPTPSAVGLAVQNLAAVYTNTPVRLQPGAREFVDDIAGKTMGTRANYTAIFGAAVTLRAGDVIQVASVQYEATGQQEVESLGLLTFAACTRLEG